MKWFKHMTDTRWREDIVKLLNERSGTMLYGIYCLVLETIAERMDGISDCSEVTYPIKEWAEIAHVDVRTFTRFLQVCSELADFMQGKESAEQALADVEAAYISAAKEKGFLN